MMPFSQIVSNATTEVYLWQVDSCIRIRFVKAVLILIADARPAVHSTSRQGGCLQPEPEGGQVCPVRARAEQVSFDHGGAPSTYGTSWLVKYVTLQLLLVFFLCFLSSFFIFGWGGGRCIVTIIPI